MLNYTPIFYIFLLRNHSKWSFSYGKKFHITPIYKKGSKTVKTTTGWSAFYIIFRKYSRVLYLTKYVFLIKTFSFVSADLEQVLLSNMA